MTRTKTSGQVTVNMMGEEGLSEGRPRLDLPALWAVFRRRLYLFLAVSLATLALVVVITFQLTPKYDATARVVLNARETQALDVSAIISGMSPDAAVVDTEVEIIRSRLMATRVAERLDLYADPEFGGAPPAQGTAAAGILPDQLAAPSPDEALRRAQTIDALIDAVTAERVGITYAIVITVRSREAEKAARIANAYAEQYVRDGLDRKFETYELVNSYLDDAVEDNRQRLRVAEDAVERYRAESGLLSAEGALLSEQQVADLQAELVVQEADLAERAAKLSTVNRRVELGAGADAISEVLASPVIGALRSKEADLVRRKSDLETRYGERHPQIDNVNSEMAELQQQIRGEVSRIVAGLQNDVDVARQRVQSLRASINNMRTSLTSDNQALVRLRELEREAQVSRRSYEQLLARAQQAELFEDLAEADARIADPATAPTTPAFPNKLLNLALGLLLGGALGAFAITLAEMFDSGLRAGDDVERALDAPLLTMVPLLRAAGAPPPADYIVDRPLSSFAESYRTLRSALALRKTDEGKGQIVALASAVSGEGKTVATICLGRIAALAGDKVVVIDADVRRRMLSAAFDDAGVDAPGLAEVLSGAAPLSAAVRRDPRSTLDVLPVSADRSGVGDLFGSPRFARLLAHLQTKYDLILIDTAPLTAVADSRTVVNSADLAVLFVKWKSTPRQVARLGRKILSTLKTPVLGVVLTQVDMRAQAGYGYQGSSRYYAQNGKYYFD